MLVTSVTSQHTFSALRRLKKCLRITMKQELPEQLPTDALSQIDYGHTKQWGLDCNEVCLCQRTTQNAFLKNLNRGMCMAEWDMSPPPPRFKTRTPPLMFSFTCRLLFIISTHKVEVSHNFLSIKIVLTFFHLLILKLEILKLNLMFAVYVKLKLSNGVRFHTYAKTK